MVFEATDGNAPSTAQQHELRGLHTANPHRVEEGVEPSQVLRQTSTAPALQHQVITELPNVDIDASVPEADEAS